MDQLWESTGQGWLQVAELLLAFVLSSVIGLERELRQKSAGLRTHALVGVGAALFMLVSKYGFFDVLSDHVTLDPSRVAAQIVSGIGFIGGGLIFVRRDTVSGLTTAASIWLTAAVGMAAGAGLAILAVVTTVLFLVAVPGYAAVVRRLPRSRSAYSELEVVYAGDEGVLDRVVATCAARGFAVRHLATRHPSGRGPGNATVKLRVQGAGSVAGLSAALADVDGVLDVEAEDVNVTAE